jgi:hypothetical protein
MYSKCRSYNFLSNRFLTFWQSLNFIFLFWCLRALVAEILAKNSLQRSKATDNEKNDNMVDRAIDADARSVSLFNWEERIYSAGDVGKAK